MNIDQLISIKQEQQKAHGVLKSQKLDIILFNHKLRELAVKRLIEKRINLRAVIAKYGLNSKLEIFLNTKNPTGHYEYSYMQWDYIIFLRAIGFDIRVKAVDVEMDCDDCLFDDYISFEKKKQERKDNINKIFFKEHETDPI